MTTNATDKWYALAGSTVCMLALGTIYTWSLFNQPLADEFGWRIEDVAFTFALTSISLSVASLFASKLESTFGIRKVAVVCGLCIGIGFFLASRATTLMQLYLSAGILVGAADGVAYMMILGNCIKWFPLNKGLIAGISAGAYGTGSLIFKYLNLSALMQCGTLLTFAYWGTSVIVLMTAGAWLLRPSPPITAAKRDALRIAKNIANADFTWQEMTCTKEAWLLFFVFFSCCMSGLFLISVAQGLASDWAQLPMLFAARAVTIVAVANTLGRLVLGQLSDVMTRIRVVSLITVCILLPTLLLLFIPLSTFVFFTCVGLIAFSFGGVVAVFPALIGDFFGLYNMTKNYSLIYQGFGLGAVVGSFISVWLGGFFSTFILIAVLSATSLLITLCISRPVKKSTADTNGL